MRGRIIPPGVWLLVFFIGSTGLALDNSGNKVLLQNSLAAGDKYLANVAVDTIINQTVAGYRIKRVQKALFQIEFKITALDARGIATVNATYQRVTVENQSPFESGQFSSDQPPAIIPPVFKGVAGLSGKTFTFQANGKGLIPGAGQPNVPENGPPDLYGINRTSLWGGSLFNAVTNFWGIMPPGPVGLKEPWKQSLTLPSENCPVAVETGFELSEIQDQAVMIRLFGQVIQSVKNPYQIKLSAKDSFNGETVINLAGTVRGEIKVAAKNAMIRSGELIAALVGEVRNLDRPVPVTIDMKINFETGLN